MSKDKNDFASLLTQQMKKATGAVPPPEEKPKTKPETAPVAEPAKVPEAAPAAEAPPPVSAPRKAAKKAGKGIGGRNTNRVTVNLFEADSRALGVIKELLGTAGHDFTSRSDSMKVGLRLAAKAKPEELAKLLEQVRAEDRRFTKETE